MPGIARGLHAFFPDDALARIERGNARSILAAMGEGKRPLAALSCSDTRC
jgi:hypothetical protein